MFLYIKSCQILLVALIVCVIPSASKSNTASSILPIEIPEGKHSSTKVTLSMEGGPMTPDAKGLTLLPENHSFPVSSKDLSKNKVVARKGVVYSESITQSQENASSRSNEKTTNKISTSGDKPSILNEGLIKTINEVHAPKGNGTSVNKTMNTSANAKNVESINVPKKPLILIATKLENTTENSPGYFDNNQVQSPKISYMQNPNGPGMVMPVIITILLVPTFAVLGYMAVRRGQEAWKNRHYKRMDFLLDGMYND